MMTTPTFTEALAGRVLVCDGSAGTMLCAKGIFLNRSFDELNLTQPDLVADVPGLRQGRRRRDRDQYLRRQSGEAAPFGLADQVKAINAQGAKSLARRRVSRPS